MVDNKKIEDMIRIANIPQYKPEVIKAIIVQEATRQGVPVELALAVAQQESGFNNKAVSKANTDGSRDHGVMQLNDKYHKLKNVYDPYENIKYGVGMLRDGLKRNKGDIAKTLSDYNAGANATGAGRKAGDSYAQKVISIARGINPQGVVTGAAAPIPSGQDSSLGTSMRELSQGALTQGEKIVEKYIKDAGYNTKAYREIRDQKQKEIKETLDEIKKLPDSASPEQLQAITNQYAQAKNDLNNAYGTAIAGIQSGIGADTIDNYYNKLINADEARLQRMQAANPYTQLSNQTQVNPIDIDKLRGQQAYNAWASRVGNALNPQAGAYDRAAQEMRDRQQLQAAQLYNATGLTPEQFIERGLMDYNNMGATLNNQQQAMIQLLNAAQQGDRQAQQIVANMQINQAVANNQMIQNEQAAKAAADAAALERAKFAAENARWGVQQGQNLDAYPLSADAAMQQERLGQTGSIMNSAANRGTNMAGNMLNYQAMLQRAAAQGAETPTDDMKTLLDIQKPILSAAGMSQNIDALPTAISNYQKSIMTNFPQYARYVDPSAPANAYQPVQGLSGFNITGQNTFRPQQQ